MEKQERETLYMLRKLIHQNEVFIRILKAYCKSELDYSLDIECLFINFDNIIKNQDKMCKILDKVGL